MSKRKMTSKRTNNANWRLAALLPLGAALNGMAIVADQPTKAQAAEKKEITLPAVKVKATRDNKSGNYKTGTSTVGTKTDTPLIETPQSISVITNDQMEAQNVSTMAEALRYTPGV
ncbi:TonB-dependent receptor-like protein [Methylobacter tundripaludum]|uniref:TonB-dependent receptor-like protein n=1 Tax=Methylobacter tundripaludum TaxID=173365 RepID=A0A2S6HFK7_9GAMM|nr:TonB-dependent receptor-like protein [Methylobacter tundripaludum]